MSHEMTLSVIAPTLDPVSTQIPSPLLSISTNFGESIRPTHSIANAPPLDVLIIPGGYGCLADNLDPVIEFIKKTYPSLQYLFTVSHGSWLAAGAGVLDGKRATSIKLGWANTTAELTGIKEPVQWVSNARWVVDGNCWTTSGASAGVDGMLALIGSIFGEEVAEKTANVIEYVANKNSECDSFTDKQDREL
jgi:transcriptional regulator GlxA family with amidase domain